MFTQTQKQAFETDGYVRIPAVIAASDMREMYDRLWTLLETKGPQRNDPSTWTAEHFGFVSGLQAIRRGDPAPADSAELTDALDAVFDGGHWQSKPNWGQALVTFPKPGAWVVPHTIWHLDHPYNQPDHITGVNVFLFVDDVEPGGGGTAAIQSSPALVRRFVAGIEDIESLKHSTLNKRFIRSHPWLNGLSTRPSKDPDRAERYMMRDTDLDGIAARIVELTGRAGDVMLCHPCLVHAPAPNTSDRPRLMRTLRVARKD